MNDKIDHSLSLFLLVTERNKEVDKFIQEKFDNLGTTLPLRKEEIRISRMSHVHSHSILLRVVGSLLYEIVEVMEEMGGNAPEAVKSNIAEGFLKWTQWLDKAKASLQRKESDQ